MGANAKGLFEQAVKAYRAKDKRKTLQLLRETLALDVDHQQAWLLYSKVLDDDTKRLQAIELALKLKPDDPVAQEMQLRQLEKMGYGDDEETHVPQNTARPATATRKPATQPAAARKPATQPAAKKAPSQPTAPARPADLPPASAKTLGTLRADVGVRWSEQIKRLVIVGGALPLLAVVGLVAQDIYATYQQTQEGLPLLVLCGALLIFLAISGLYMLYAFVATLGLGMRVYDQGIGVRSLLMGEQFWRWREIDYFSFRDQIVITRLLILPIFGRLAYHTRAYKDNQRIFAVTKSVQKFREVGELILRLSKLSISQRYADEFRRTGSFRVDDIVVDRGGIKQGKKGVEWGDIRRVEIIESGLTVERSNGSFTDFNIHALNGTILTAPIVDAIVFVKNSTR